MLILLIRISFFIAILSFLNPSLGFTTTPASYDISDLHERGSINIAVDYLENDKEDYTINDVIKSYEKDIFTSAKDRSPPGLGKSIWNRFTLENKSSKPIPFIYEINYPFNGDTFVFYQETNGNIESITDPSDINTDRRISNPLGYKNPIFNIIQNTGTRTYYVKRTFEGTAPLNAHMTVWEETNFREVSLLEYLLIGSTVGITIAMFFYNLFLYAATRLHIYRYYILYVFFWTLSAIAFSGIGGMYLWKAFPFFVWNSPSLLSCIAMICLLAFARDFLHTKTYTPRLDVSLKFFIGWYLFLFFFVIFSSSLATLFVSISPLIVVPFLFVTAILVFLRGNISAKYYIIAWSFFLLGIILYCASNVGLLPSNPFTRWAMFIGASIEVMLLSFALANRINLLRDDKDKAESLYKQTLETAKENLEINVNERTRELQEVLHELKANQKQLIEAEKMASLGQLVAGVAHEINTPIGVGVTAASFLSSETQEMKILIEEDSLKRSSLTNYVDNCLKSSNLLLGNLQRAAGIIRRFKMVSSDLTNDDIRQFDVARKKWRLF